jgi:RNA polymerase sigma-70 factor (ECF subfamily)
MAGDGGGKAPQWRTGITGAANVARVLAPRSPRRSPGSAAWWSRGRWNGQPGAVFRDRDGKVLNTWTLDVLDGRIPAIRAVLNPTSSGT